MTLNELGAAFFNREEPQFDSKASFFAYHDNTYNIISKVAYLIGVPERIFLNPNESPMHSVYQTLKTDKNARIIRNLCMMRTALERGYAEIYRQIRYELKNIYSMPDLIPQDSLMELENDGVSIIKANTLPTDYIITINRQISNRINNVKSLFPVWLEWNYIRDLFLMPDGMTEKGIKAAANEYYAHKNAYPYQVYINWPSERNENILYTDSKFVKRLYELHEDVFEDMSKVTDAGENTKNEIYDFLDTADRVEIVVDCENSDPYKLYAMLNNLNQEALLDRISRIVLIDDVHTTMAWSVLNEFTRIPVDHIVVERISQNKSLVDHKLIAEVCKEYYQGNADAFILASSDSDFWSLISSLPQAKFYVLVESAKCGQDIKRELDNGGYSYCYLDNFCTGNSDSIRTQVVLDCIKGKIEGLFSFNLNTMLDEALYSTRANLSETERRQFYDRYLKSLRLCVGIDGNVAIQFGG